MADELGAIMTPAPPLLTVVLIAGNRRERVQRTLQSLLEQDIADQIVTMVYDRADQPARDIPELNRPNIVYEAVDRHSTLGPLQKRATLAASTDIIAFIEEHVVVPPGWAQESLRLHAEGYAGVTGVFVRKSPFLVLPGFFFRSLTGATTCPSKRARQLTFPEITAVLFAPKS